MYYTCKTKYFTNYNTYKLLILLTMTNDRPVLLSERASYIDKSVAVKH
jgi:hypothetical protein